MADLLIGSRVQMIYRVAMDYPPEVLVEKSRDLARALGYTASPWPWRTDLLTITIICSMSSASTNRPPAGNTGWVTCNLRRLRFGTARVHGRCNRTHSESAQYEPDDPPPIISGMISVTLDPQGRLMEFDAVPPQVDKSSGEAVPPDWKRLFDAAGLDMSSFSATTPQWTPLGICDARGAWTGVLSSGPKNPVRVEAAAWRGKPIYFHIVGPWTRPERMQPFMFNANLKALVITGLGLSCLLLAAAVLLARNNIRRGRGDRRGAMRLAGFTGCVCLLIWIFGGAHVASFGELVLFFGALGFALLLAGAVWILYMAIEPIARRRWPHSMISWNRLLAGSIHDPLVGRDVLIGLTLGTASALVANLHFLVIQRFGSMPSVAVQPGALGGVKGALSGFLTLIPNCVSLALVWFVLIFVLRVILRRDWLAAGVFVLIYMALNGVATPASPLVAALFGGVATGLLVFAMLRFGLVALIASAFVYELLLMFPITADFSVWYAGASLFALLSVAAMAAYALQASLAGQSLFDNAEL